VVRSSIWHPPICLQSLAKLLGLVLRELVQMLLDGLALRFEGLADEAHVRVDHGRLDGPGLSKLVLGKEALLGELLVLLQVIARAIRATNTLNPALVEGKTEE